MPTCRYLDRMLDAATDARTDRAPRTSGAEADRRGHGSGCRYEWCHPAASQFLPPCRFAAKALAARRENIGRTRLATKGRGHPYANVCKKQRIIPASMRPAALGRRIPAVNVAVAVAAIIFAHVMTVLLVWLLYEVPKLALESSR